MKLSKAMACALPVLLGAVTGGSWMSGQATAGQIVTSPPKPFVLPAYERVVMKNGLTVLLLEKHDTPLISMNLTLRSGSVYDPAGKEGVATLTAQLLRRGTEGRTADQVSDELDAMGMQFGSSAGPDSTTVYADFLKKDAATALPLVADIELHARFPDAEVSKKLERAQDEARGVKDEPQAALQGYFRKFLYGSGLYGRPANGDEISIKAITRADILAFYKANYTPANAVLAVAGDFDSSQMKAMLEQSFGKWSGAAPVKPALTATAPVKGRRLLLVDKPDATQTYFIMGNVGIDATNPDRGSIQVVNTLYGGRFTSLFNTELRIKSGYSYGAASRFTESRLPGPFAMSTYTRNATTGPAMDKTLEVIDTAHAQGFTDAQLASAKNTIAGSLPPQMETSQALANTMARNELYGITRDQFNANLVALGKTTVADEKRVLEKYYPTADNLVIVVVGKAAEIEPLMGNYTKDITKKKIGDPGF